MPESEFGIREILLVNPEYWALESGIPLKESGIQFHDWSSTSKESEFSRWNPKSTTRNPGSKTVLDSTAWGD